MKTQWSNNNDVVPYRTVALVYCMRVALVNRMRLTTNIIKPDIKLSY